MDLPSTRSASHIMSWDIEGNLSKEITALQKIIGIKQRDYNQVHHKAEKKEEILKKLQFELSGLSKDAGNEPKTVLSRRVLEYNEILKALGNENYYIETLAFMLNDRRNNLKRKEPPVLKIKEDLTSKKRDISELQSSIQQEFRDFTEMTKDIMKIEKEIIQIEEVTRKAYNSNLNSLKQKKSLKEILQKEYNLNAKIKHYDNLEKMIKEIEPIQAFMESEEKNVADHAHILKNKELLENKFLKLREVASTNKIEEVFASYETLKEHSEMLEDAAKQSLQVIDTLTLEKRRLNTELNEIILNHESDRKINYRDLKDKNKSMDENERVLKNLGNMMGAICSSVTRLSAQLVESQSAIDVKPRNVVKYFDRCIEKIEEKLNYMANMKLTREEEKMLYKKFPKFFDV